MGLGGGGRGEREQDTHDRAPSASGHPARLTARRLDVSHTKLRSHLDHASSRTALLNPISPINLLGNSWYPSAASSAVRRPPWAMIALPSISVGGRSTSPGDVAYAYVMLTLTRHTTYGACRACGAPDSAGCSPCSSALSEKGVRPCKLQLSCISRALTSICTAVSQSPRREWSYNT